MDALGNMELFQRRKIGFLASSKIASLSVLPSIEWAVEVAKREDVAIVSGFHSRLERQVLEFLLTGKCGIICVLARSIYKKVPLIYKSAYEVGRVLFIAPCQTSASMASRKLCHERNEYVASISDEMVFASLRPESSLSALADLALNPTLL